MLERRKTNQETGLPEPQLIMMSVVSAILALFIILCSSGKVSDIRAKPILSGLGRAFPSMQFHQGAPTSRAANDSKTQVSPLPPDLFAVRTPNPKVTEYLFQHQALFPRGEISLSARALENLTLVVKRHSANAHIIIAALPESDDLLALHNHLTLLALALKRIHSGEIKPMIWFGATTEELGQFKITVTEAG